MRTPSLGGFGITLLVALCFILSVGAAFATGEGRTATLNMDVGGQVAKGSVHWEADGAVTGQVELVANVPAGAGPLRADGDKAAGRYNLKAEFSGKCEGGIYGVISGTAKLSGSFTAADGAAATIAGDGTFEGSVSEGQGLLEIRPAFPNVNFTGAGLASPQPFRAALPPFSFSPVEPPRATPVAPATTGAPGGITGGPAGIAAPTGAQPAITGDAGGLAAPTGAPGEVKVVSGTIEAPDDTPPGVTGAPGGVVAGAGGKALTVRGVGPGPMPAFPLPGSGGTTGTPVQPGTPPPATGAPPTTGAPDTGAAQLEWDGGHAAASLGIKIGLRAEKWAITSVLPDSLAMMMELRPGDLIESINNQATAGLSVAQMKALFTVPAGNSISFTIAHPGEAEHISLTVIPEPKAEN